MTNLTKRLVEGLEPRERDYWIWDDSLTGFGVRVKPSGVRSYLVQYRNATGHTRKVTFGRHGVLTAEEARGRARKLLAEVAYGLDPAVEKRTARDAQNVGELCDAYLELHSKPRKRSWKDDVQRLNAYVKPRLGRLIAREVKRADVCAFHRWIGENHGRYVANRTVALLSHIFTWSEREGLLPAGHPNPARGVERYREHPRDRWLSPDEVGRVVEAVQRESNPHVRAYFLLAILLGTRKRELLRARWADVDEVRWVLKLPETKNGRRHELPLARPARELLTALPRARDNPHVFPGAIEGQALSVPTIDQAWRRIRDAAKISDARLHDLRRTLGSWITQQTGSLALVGALLNHSDPRVTAAHYARFADGHRRDALEAHGQAVLAAAEIRGATDLLKPNPNAVRLQQGAPSHEGVAG